MKIANCDRYTTSLLLTKKFVAFDCGIASFLAMTRFVSLRGTKQYQLLHPKNLDTNSYFKINHKIIWIAHPH